MTDDREMKKKGEEESKKDPKKDKAAYEKKAEDKGGRDWTKRTTFKPTDGV